MNKIKCENCEYMKCADVIYKSHYCTVDEDNTIPLGIDYPIKSCQKKKREVRFQMTEKEAIRELKHDCAELGKVVPRHTNDKEMVDTAYGMAIAALENRIAKRPIKKPDKYSDLVQHYYCPICGRYFGQRGIHNVILFSKERYCQGDGCGQALDWSEE